MFHGVLEFALDPPRRGGPERILEDMLVVRSLDEDQGPSWFHGHGPWLVCEVALSLLEAI